MTTHVRDSVTIIHGPKGCTHHNFSLLHATGFDNDHVSMPDLISTGLSESDIIFGGEAALERTLDAVGKRNIGAVFVLSTCIVDTIGDIFYLDYFTISQSNYIGANGIGSRKKEVS